MYSSMDYRRKGFTLIELLVVMAVIIILAAIMYAAYGMVRKAAHQTTCLSNVKQLGLALLMYTSDYGGSFPMVSGDTTVIPSPTPNMTGLLDYVDWNYGLFRCPTDIAVRPVGYYPCSYGFAGIGTEYYPIGTYGHIDGTGLVTPSLKLPALRFPHTHILVAEVKDTYLGATDDETTSRGTITTVNWSGWGAQRLGEANAPLVVGTTVKDFAIGRHKANTLSSTAFADGHARMLSKAMPVADAGSLPNIVSLGVGYPSPYTIRY